MDALSSKVSMHKPNMLIIVWEREWIKQKSVVYNNAIDNNKIVRSCVQSLRLTGSGLHLLKFISQIVDRGSFAIGIQVVWVTSILSGW